MNRDQQSVTLAQRKNMDGQAEPVCAKSLQFTKRNRVLSEWAFSTQRPSTLINEEIRTGDRGFANIEFQHDITSLNLSYGIDYNYPIWAVS